MHEVRSLMALSSRTHRTAIFALAAAAIFAVAGLCSRGSRASQSAPQPAAASPQFYTQRVQPIFAANCYRCHGGMNHHGGLHLDSRNGILAGGKHGVVVVPGHPEQSLLIKLIRHEGPAGNATPMPPKSKLSDADVATVTRWIQAGAVMPPDPPQ
jgi:mono/diheme cytochrome c family protein